MNDRDRDMFFDGVCAGLAAAYFHLTAGKAPIDGASEFISDVIEECWFKLLAGQKEALLSDARPIEREEAMRCLGLEEK